MMMRFVVVAFMLMSTAGCAVSVSGNTFLPPARPGAAPTIEFVGDQVEDYPLEIPGIGVIHVARLDAPGDNRVVIYHGGRGFQMKNAARRVGALSASFDADVIVFDYPGVGASDAPRSIETMKALGPALYDTLKDGGWLAEDAAVFAYGFSLGGVMATNLADHRPIDGLVIEASAPDVAAIGRNLLPPLARPFIRVNVSDDVASFDYLGAARRYAGPILLIAGTEDEIADIETMRTFSDQLNEAGAALRYVEIDGASHGEAFYAPDGRAATTEWAGGLTKSDITPARPCEVSTRADDPLSVFCE